MSLTMDRTTDEELLLEKIKLLGNRPHPDSERNISDSVDHPPHYNNSPAKCDCGRRIECIDITRHLSFNIGNAIKYLWRVDLKNSSVEDLRKAAWYIQDEIKQRIK